MIRTFAVICAAIACCAPAAAATPRETLVAAAFDTPSKPAALAQVTQALAQAEAALAANPADHEAQVARAMGIGYRAKLTRSAKEAKRSRQYFEAIAAAAPRDPEAQLLLAGWHLDLVNEGFLAASVMGAKKDAGLAGIDRAVALGGDRAMYRGFAALMRARLNPDDPMIRALAEQAAAAPTPTALDRIAKRDAGALLVPLRAGDAKATQTMAKRLLPFGRF